MKMTSGSGKDRGESDPPKRPSSTENPGSPIPRVPHPTK